MKIQDDATMPLWWAAMIIVVCLGVGAFGIWLFEFAVHYFAGNP